MLTPVLPPGLNFTSAPQVRTDCLSGRWILTIIEVPSTSPTTPGDTPNRLLIALSDAARAGLPSGRTGFTPFLPTQPGGAANSLFFWGNRAPNQTGAKFGAYRGKIVSPRKRAPEP